MGKIKRFKQWIAKQWADIKGNAKWTFITSALGAGGWVWYYWDYYSPRLEGILMVIIPPVAVWIEEHSASSLFLLIASVCYLLCVSFASVILAIDAVKTWWLKGGRGPQEVEFGNQSGVLSLLMVPSEPPQVSINSIDQFTVELADDPVMRWKKWPESSLRPLVQDTVVVSPDNLALAVQLNVKSPLEREVEVTLGFLNTGWPDIPDNRPRLSKVSTGLFTISFDLSSQIDPGFYHAEVSVTPVVGEKKGLLFSFEIPRVYPEF